MTDSTGKSVWMTDEQLFGLLEELSVRRVFRPAGGRVTLALEPDGKQETLTVTELKTRSLNAIRDLEEQRLDAEDNHFAQSLAGGLPVGGANTVPVQFLKRNDQLSDEEQQQKERLLESIDEQISYHRLIIAGMNHLQVNYKELAPQLQADVAPAASRSASSPDSEGRVPWTKGIKAAALQCLKDSRLSDNCGKSELDLCREFLSTYLFEEDEDYTPQHLFLNIQQIKALDQPD